MKTKTVEMKQQKDKLVEFEIGIAVGFFAGLAIGMMIVGLAAVL